MRSKYTRGEFTKNIKMPDLKRLGNLKIDKDFKAERVIVPSFNFFTDKVRSFTTTVNANSFFVPYKGPRDVAKAVAAPFYAPFVWGVLSVAAAAVTIASAIASLGFLLMSGGAAIARKKEASADYLSRSTQLAIVAGASIITTIGLAAMTAISGPENLVKLATRTGKTIKDAIAAPKEEEPTIAFAPI
ncbi:hypothetical protein ACNVED_12870 [Legionella sp. D16C41]|uniref:hypothetical protein n=1 Tax=Legionella sp. D16C41 TaxID=3402688 RepID=UPI003AF5AC03